MRMKEYQMDRDDNPRDYEYKRREPSDAEVDAKIDERQQREADEMFSVERINAAIRKLNELVKT